MSAQPHKDAFFVFSMSHPVTHRLVEGAKALLAEVGFDAWDYDDWTWQSLDNRTYGRSGTRIDVRRLGTGHPSPLYRPRPGSVDEVELDRLLRESRVVACVGPLPEGARGVWEEVDLLRRRDSSFPVRPYSLLRFEVGAWQEELFDRLDFDEVHWAPVDADAPPEVHRRLAGALGLAVLRHLIESEPRRGEGRRWSDRVAAAREEVGGVLRRLAADADTDEASSTQATGALRDQVARLEDVI